MNPPIIRYRMYGARGPLVTLLHGGPGAPGHLEGIAVELAPQYRVLEPFERRADDAGLTVARHIEDLNALLAQCAGDDVTAVIGFSSGAITALSFAARHPERVSTVVLIGSATMTQQARSEFQRRFDRLLDDEGRARLRRTESLIDDDVRLAARARIVLPYYFVDPIAHPTDAWLDGRGHTQTWRDMMRLQETDVQPQEFASIRAPALMLHGADDPHPGALIQESLLPFIPHLQYVELPHCGHYPWLERAARDQFFRVLAEWLRTPSQPADTVKVDWPVRCADVATFRSDN